MFGITFSITAIASGYAVLGMMLYEMEFGTGFGYGAAILALHVLTAWGLAKFLG